MSAEDTLLPTPEATELVLPQCAQKMLQIPDEEPFKSDFEYYQMVESIEVLQATATTFRQGTEDVVTSFNNEDFATPGAPVVNRGRLVANIVDAILERALAKQKARLEVCHTLSLLHCRI